MAQIVEIAASLLMLTGLFFFMTTAIGIFRFGDIYSRLHASTKGTTLGLACVLTSSILYFSLHGEISFRQFLILIFLFVTSPASAHILSRAAYRKKVPTWHRMRVDEWKEHFH